MKSFHFFKKLPGGSQSPFQKWTALGKVISFPKLLLLPILLLLAWLLPSASRQPAEDFSPEKVNLALRRTADRLLRAAGDSTSRIPAIEQAGGNTWRARLEQPFSYEALPAVLQASLDQHGIQRPYTVAIRRCTDAEIELGYHQADFLKNKREEVPCGGRAMPAGCHFIEVTFVDNGAPTPFWMSRSGALLLLLGGLAGAGAFSFFNRKKQTLPVPAPAAEAEAASQVPGLAFGNSRLDVAGQMLLSGEVRQALTFRETKLLRLFAEHSDRLLERDFIIQQVWADEGVLVGRSVDVFVSRLRKKLAADPSVGIVAVHGVGYRLETGKAVAT